jgi:hypothetical protein|tara:strand:- start:3108 stop:3479 length:372 start_codon:yes stop_codon:yes gene_type:complete
MITQGIANFINLEDTEMFNNQDTGKYSIMLTIDDDQVKILEDAGVKVKEYKNQKQRKFVTRYAGFEVLDVDGNPTSKNIPYGSTVRVLWEAGKPHPVHGSAPYFKKIKVLELAEHDVEGSEDF